MDGRLVEGVVYVGDDGRQRFYDARGYGRRTRGTDPVDSDGVALSPVEAAHLLVRGDLDAVVEGDRRLDARAFLDRVADPRRGESGFLPRFLAYADLRERGFYLSPARRGWPGTSDDPSGVDFAVYPRGQGPADGGVAHRVRAVGERHPVRVADLPEVLAVADEESDVTYFAADRPDVTGTSEYDPPAVEGDLLADRAVVYDPPARLYRRGFFGRPLAAHDADDALQLSLVEAAYLADRGALALSGADDPRGRGRAVEGDRFDRRLRTYADLRERGVVPKTGFKFGADFRTYADVDDVDDLGHSELLVRVLPVDRERTPRELALDVRLAHGVRKRMVFALVGEDVTYRSVERITP
jgi:tRNA-intron endonuclease